MTLDFDFGLLTFDTDIIIVKIVSLLVQSSCSHLKSHFVSTEHCLIKVLYKLLVTPQNMKKYRLNKYPTHLKHI